MRFQGRRAVVTGGLSGIGEAVAKRITAEGGKVVVWDMQGGIKTDTRLVQLVCEQLDRRELIKDQIQSDPTDPTWYRQANEIEKAIVQGLSLLGFSPADRTRLGFVSAKTKSKLEEIIAKRQSRE